ncbi:Fc.00g049170.m01.CDS01 [Cosmosporella sp. VM-42]
MSTESYSLSWEPGCPALAPNSHRILFIDAYDSFTNNIVSLLENVLGAHVDIVHIDAASVDKQSTKGKWDKWTFAQLLQSYDAVVCGPGPGSPLNPEDVGIFSIVWDLVEAIPVLGICLGFQSLVAHHGGKIRRLRRGLHGMVRKIEHRDNITGDIFCQVPSFTATLYHSLCADIGQDNISPEAWRKNLQYTPTPSCPELMPLAWAREMREDGSDERILMGVKHARKPFWGLQYHPESVCTDPTAHAVLKNWFTEALRWNKQNNRMRKSDESFGRSRRHSLSPKSHLEALAIRNQLNSKQADSWWEEPSSEPIIDDMKFSLENHLLRSEYTCQKIPLPDGVGVPEVVGALGLADDEAIILDSSSSGNGDPLAKFSIVAAGVDKALRFEYHASDNLVTVRRPGEDAQEISLRSETNVWEVISDFWKRRQKKGLETEPSPFKGGFMGFITYELGLYGLETTSIPKKRGHRRPDLCLAWVTKSVVLDHKAGVVYVQNLASEEKDDLSWAEAAAQMIQQSPGWQGLGSKTESRLNGDSGVPGGAGNRLHIKEPCPAIYESQVRTCQDEIAAGESYELCLTTQTTMSRPRGKESPWKIYQTLRKRQPAPFGSFIRLGGATLLSSSPERFLSHDSNGLCSMRPMKGTVRKSDAVSTLAEAELILHVPKEEAENLMIVDLVRHDLHGVCGAGNVTVPDLMKVEEYATVFQMITVVNGQLPHVPENPYTGLDALAAALPPGSMTGAPKKRSCEILQRIEGHQERSLYSGVVGFMDVTGNGDWSVTIRTMFRWDDEVAAPAEGEIEPREVWRIGAGGAVTILSTPEGEREEMFTKLAGPLGVFRDVA